MLVFRDMMQIMLNYKKKFTCNYHM